MAVLYNCFFFFLLRSACLALITVKVSSESFQCDLGFFFDLTQEKCKKCSAECPKGYYPEQGCTNISDIKCKSYYPVDLKPGTGFRGTSDFQSSNLESFKESGLLPKKQMVNEDLHKVAEEEFNTVESEDRYWKTLAFALIGLLSVLIIATFIVLIFVYRKLQRSIVIKQSEEGDLVDDADSGYVVIRAIHHLASPQVGDHHTHSLLVSSFPQEPPRDDTPQCPLLLSSGLTSIDSGRAPDSVSTAPLAATEETSSSCYLPKLYQPQRRLLTYDADDVFESDDNASVNHSGELTKEISPSQPLMDHCGNT